MVKTYDSYKDSGIAWIGEIPSEWKVCRVKHISNISSGEMISKEEHVDNGKYPIIGSNGEIGRINMTNNNDEVLTTGRVGSIGTVQLVKESWITDNALVLKIRENTNIRYVFYALPLLDYQFMSTGTAQPLITASTLKMQSVPLPSLADQHSIASFLDSKCSEIDSLISLQEEMISELQAYKQSVITEAVTKGLDPNAKMKDSGVEWIGEIPEGWNMIKITHLLDPNHNYPIGDGDHGMISPKDYKEYGIPYLRVQNLGYGTELILDNIVYISEEDNEKIKGSTLFPGDVLFAKTGATIGKTGIIPDDMPRANTTSHIGKISVSNKYYPKWLMYVLASDMGNKQFWDIAGQKTTRPELAISEIRMMQILTPSTKEEQQAIATYLDTKTSQIDSLISLKQEKIQELKDYKKSIIYEYVTGKKRV